MPEYGTPQSGWNITDAGKNLRAISPGDNYTFLDGTEADEAMASVAIVRGPSVSKSQAFGTFTADNLGAGETVDVEISNTDEDGDYKSIGQMTSLDDSPPGFPYLTDSGSALFYRVRKSGGTPIVKVQR